MNNILSSLQSLVSFTQLTDNLPQLDNKSLVIFDVGEVLLQATSSFFHPKNKPYKERGRAYLKNILGQEEYEKIWSLSFLQEWRELVDHQAPMVIKKIQESGAKVMALSAMRTGTFGLIESMESWRLSRLADVGIDFSLTAPVTDSFVIADAIRDGFAPIFRDGILFTYVHAKGEALDLFLKKIHWQPSIIIFVDDKVHYLTSVQEMAASAKIPFMGFHYMVSHERPFIFDEQLFNFQLNHLIDHKEWVHDDAARAMMMHHGVPLKRRFFDEKPER